MSIPIAPSRAPRVPARRAARAASVLARLLMAAGLIVAATGGAKPAAAAAVAAGAPDPGALRAHVAALADTSAGGRPIGGDGIDRAADYIARAFQSNGIAPGFAGSYFEEFTARGTAMRNVGGILTGARRPGQAVVLGAHYDGLDRDPAGRARAGADDNASGVAVLLEVARLAAAEAAAGRPPARTLVFVAFSGEEAGLLGSSEYVRHPAVPLDSTVAMINLDTVGRLRDETLTVFGVGSAEEFAALLDGLNLAAGFVLQKIVEDSGSSDQLSFYARRVPVLHFFTGPHEDYHRAGDTAEKVNIEGMTRIASFTAETLEYLARRREPLTFRMVGTKRPAEGRATERRVTLGAIPDFAHSGPGVLLRGTLPGSPADRAGLVAGDVLVEIGGEGVDNLADLQAALKNHKPGDYVTVVYRRGTATLRADVTLVERR